MSERLVKSAAENFPQIWRYQASDRIPGAFRAISVKNLLLEPTPTISVYEWADLNWSSPPAYAAISHTWTQSEAVLKICKSQNRPLMIDTGELNQPFNREIYWTGLVQAAHAARRLDCEYLWLDLLCIDQVSKPDAQGDNDLEKNKQIQNMGKIYKCTRAVLVMVGGVGCVQGIDELSSWIDRAWTLQEVTLSKEVWAVVDWPYQDDFRLQPLCLDDPNDDVGHEKYHFQFIQVKDTIKIIRLVKLLTLEPVLIPNIPDFKMRCFDSNVHISEHNLSGKTAASSALYSMMKSETKEMTNCGAWRCMFQRTATKEEDMIYSMMELIGVQLEVDYGRNLKDLYSEVAKNVAAKGLPAWLSIGGASGDIIPRDPLSGLIPQLPTYRGNELPTYKIGNTFVPVTRLLEDSLNYVSHFDVRFPTSSVPHLVCCRTFEFPPPRHLAPDRRTGDLVQLNRLILFKTSAELTGVSSLSLVHKGYAVITGRWEKE